eukprot:3562552-Heterocapsa_arctica.AAC.1
MGITAPAPAPSWCAPSERKPHNGRCNKQTAARIGQTWASQCRPHRAHTPASGSSSIPQQSPLHWQPLTAHPAYADGRNKLPEQPTLPSLPTTDKGPNGHWVGAQGFPAIYP